MYEYITSQLYQPYSCLQTQIEYVCNMNHKLPMHMDSLINQLLTCLSVSVLITIIQLYIK